MLKDDEQYVLAVAGHSGMYIGKRKTRLVEGPYI